MESLTIVTSCGGYGRFLEAWAESIVGLTLRPTAVRIFTHGSVTDREKGQRALAILQKAGFDVQHTHEDKKLDFGTARNRSVEMSNTEWVMHLDCDDRIMPHAMDDWAALAPDADVVSFGYERAGEKKLRPLNPTRLYRSGNGLEMLKHAAPCSGVSPFRRRFWEQSPYRTDMRGAWDTALWIGFSRLGARFRATKRPVFWYWHHPDSIYTKRRLTRDWTQAITAAQLGFLRRNDHGVAVIVPKDRAPDASRVRAWEAVREHLAHFHPEWPVIEGVCRSADWCKGEAIEDALTRSTADVLVIMDSDCLVPKEALDQAVALVQDGAPWAIPHNLVHRLSAQTTEHYLTRPLPERLMAPTEQGTLTRNPYVGYAGGGILVVRRVHYEAVGGMPFAFRGWGSEDQAFALILDTLIGKHVRGTADLIHLWHEPQHTRSKPLLVQHNSRRYRSLIFAAKDGQDALYSAIRSLPGAGSNKAVPPWKRRASVGAPPKSDNVGMSLRDRQPYLGKFLDAKARKQAGRDA